MALKDKKREALFEAAHEVGGGFGGLFDFGDTMGGGMGVVHVIGKDVGVGTDHTEEIVEGVGDRSNAIGGKTGIVARVESEIHLGALSEMSLRLVFGMGGEERGVERVCG